MKFVLGALCVLCIITSASGTPPYVREFFSFNTPVETKVGVKYLLGEVREIRQSNLIIKIPNAEDRFKRHTSISSLDADYIGHYSWDRSEKDLIPRNMMRVYRGDNIRRPIFPYVSRTIGLRFKTYF